jgi:hypothetical protein
MLLLMMLMIIKKFLLPAFRFLLSLAGVLAAVAATLAFGENISPIDLRFELIISSSVALS